MQRCSNSLQLTHSLTVLEDTKMLTQAHLKSILCYSQETGQFTWIDKPSKHIASGAQAGSKTKDGYWRIGIVGQQFKAHRLAWLYVTGEWPDNQIDHINGIKTDNRFCNLRVVTPAGNMHNRRKAHKGNASGFLGVSSHHGRWKAEIRVGGKLQHIGYFSDAATAGAAYVKAKRELHPTCTI